MKSLYESLTDIKIEMLNAYKNRTKNYEVENDEWYQSECFWEAASDYVYEIKNMDLTNLPADEEEEIIVLAEEFGREAFQIYKTENRIW